MLKKTIKLIFFIVLSLGIMLSLPCRAAAEAETPMTISAYAYSLYCVNTGEFLLSGRADEKLAMASTTKIMTAILGIEALQADNNETVVTVTPDMYAEGSSMYLKAGEQILMSDLVGGMLMVSGNDAANAIALSVGGSFEEFAGMMNQKAAEIGLADTSFVTPSGLDADDHYTTACDLARLMEYCMSNSMFREIDSSASITVNFVEPKDKVQTYYNENRLLREYDYCIAGKTGYTDKAGRTLVSCAEKDGIRLIAVTLNDGDDWNDHKKMYDYGFDRLSMQKLDISFDDLTVPVAGGTKDFACLLVGEQPSVCTSGDNSEIELVYDLPCFLYAPVIQGDIAGKIRYYKNGVYAGCSDVVAAETIVYKQIPTSFMDNVVSFFKRFFV